MSETVILPGGRSTVRRRGPFIPPLLVIPFVLYNLLAFAMFGGLPGGWSSQLFSIHMVSGTDWSLTWGDLMLLIGIICLFFEVLKSTNTGRSSLIEHMLSTVLFIVFLVEFILVGAAASSTFFLLMAMSFVDVVAGFSISITGAGRDVTME
ncbi:MULTISPECIES: hypothetical protein [unclassified Devosia]|uniref:hypothetical protein n=1 Tax=unclassified Devosia TaxID=196773 RepID=UPI000A7BBAD7|nr:MULTISPECIES: hypothetical protein [unclassified Devosia]